MSIPRKFIGAIISPAKDKASQVYENELDLLETFDGQMYADDAELEASLFPGWTFTRLVTSTLVCQAPEERFREEVQPIKSDLEGPRVLIERMQARAERRKLWTAGNAEIAE